MNFLMRARKYPSVCDFAKKRKVLEKSQVAHGEGPERGRGVLVN